MLMDVTGKPEDSTSNTHLKEKRNPAFQGPRSTQFRKTLKCVANLFESIQFGSKLECTANLFSSTSIKLLKIFVVSTSAAGLIACTPTAPEFEDIGSSTYAKPTTDQELYLISDLTSNSPAISGSCDDNTVSIGMKPDGQEAWDEVATSSLDPSSDLNCIDGNFSLVISQTGTYMGFTLSLAEQKKLHIKTTGANGDSAETEATIRYLPVIPVIDVVDISPSSNEGQTATLRLTITPQATWGAVFNYQTLDISALAGNDYSAASGSVSFGAGDDFLDIPVVITTDSLFEADETFKVSLDSVAGANFGASEATVTIPANGTPPSIFVGDATGLEGETLTFLISQSEASGVNTTFVVNNHDISATGGTDYTAVGGTGSIPAGSTSVAVNVFTIEDAAFESDETFTLSLSTVVNASVGIPGTDDVGTGTIQNDDTLPNIYLTAPAPSAEGGDHVFTVSVSGTSVFNVTYSFDTFDGTATTADSDYTALSASGTLMAGDLNQTITVVSGNDGTFENDETVVLSLSSVVGALVGTPGADDLATATILNDDSGPTLHIDDLVLNEGVSSALSVSLSGTSGIDAIFTWQTFDGTAVAANSDYTGVGLTQITIPAGSSTSGLVYVDALADSLDEANENLSITLAVVSGAGTGDLSADITINDQNAAPNVYVTDVAATEDNDLGFIISLNVISGQNVSFSYQSYDGSATTADSDYGAVSGSATIPALQSQITLSVSPVDDSRFESDETMTLSISAVTNANVTFPDAIATGTIQNNDSTPQLFIGNSSVTEGQTLEFVISISALSGVDMSFDYQSYDGNTGAVTLNALLADSDYSALSGTTTIAPGELSITLLSVANQDTRLEGDEQLTVSLDNISGATIVSAGVDDVATGTINNNDTAPFIYVDDLTYAEASTGQHVVSLSEVSGLPVEYSYTVYNGSVIGSDYNVISDAVITIAAGSTTSSVDIEALSDGLDENSESYTLSLHSLSAAQTGDLEASGTITDIDPNPSIYITDENVTEPGTSTVTVSLSAASGRDVSFSYQSFDTGSATGSGGDYNDVALTVATISAGATSFTFPIDTVGDALAEGNETFDISLSSLVDVSVGDVSGTMTILDDDGPPNLTIYPVDVDEGTSGIAVASLSATSGLNVTFDWQTYNISGEAVAGSDYTAQASVEYTIAAGDLTVGLTISATNDSPLDEEDHELLMVSLSNLSNANFAVSIATVSISDMDTPPDIFVANAAGVTEGNTLQFSITLSKISGRDVIVDWQTIDGVASVASGDYTAVSSQLATFSPGTGTITADVETLNDILDEAVESVIVSLTSATSGNISDSTGSGDINDNDPLVQLAAFDAQVTEGASAVVMISLNTASGRHVSFDFDLQDGSATSGSGDYPAASGTLTIYTSDTFMLLTIPTLADASFESDEVFHISLSNSVAATFTDDFADITLINGNAPPGIYVSDVAGPITEGANADFVVSLSETSGVDVTFDYETYDDTALSAYDFTAIGTTEATIPAGQLNITLSVSTTDDLRDDSAENEFFGITITAPTNGNISVASGQVMVQDNDLAPNLFVVDLGGNEGETLSVQLSLSEESERSPTFDYQTYDGSATVSSDYQGRSETGVQFSPYTTALSVSVTLVAENIYESTDETFTVSLTPGADAGLGGDLEATLTITNTSALPQLFAVDSAPVTEGASAYFVVTMNGLAQDDVTFSWSTLDGWATEGGLFPDYTGVSNQPVIILALQSAVTVVTGTDDDGLGEPAENFFATLSGASANATIAGASAQITLNDNDGGVYLMVYGDTQDEGTDLVFTISKSSNQLADVTFDIDTYDATASLSDSDYTPISSQPATIDGGLVTGDMFITVTISTGNDTKLENNETFALSISNVTNASVATVGTDDIATGTINNNDVQPMLFVDDLAVGEGSSLTLMVSLSEISGLDSVFNWQTFDGSASIASGDYIQVTTTVATIPIGSLTTNMVTFSSTADGLDEFPEIAYVSLTPVSNVSVSNVGVDNLANINITDGDAPPQIYINDLVLDEAGTVGSFVVSISEVSAKNISFDYTTHASGTALGGGVDYNNFSGTASQILAGERAVTISGPNALTDNIYEGDETYVVSLGAVANANAGDYEGQVTIQDDEAIPNLVVFSASITEGSPLDFLISMSGANGTDVTFDFDTYDVSANQPADYGTVSQQYTISAGGLEVTIAVTTVDDNPYELTEQIQVTISNPSANVTILTAGAPGTITNGDPVPNIYVDDNPSINEGDTGDFVISLSTLSEVDAVFTWGTYTLSATSSDHTEVAATTNTIPAGQTAVTVSVVTTEDPTDEANETFLVSLATVSDVNFGVSTDLTATGTIIDDDGTPNIFATDITITEGDATYMAVSLSATLGYDVTFDFGTVDIGSATVGSDFVGMAGGQMTIPAGSLTVGITVATSDVLNNFELDETFHVTLSNVSNGASGKMFGVVTIIDNDPVPTISIVNGGAVEGTIINASVTIIGGSEVESSYFVSLYDETAQLGDGDYLATTGPFTIPGLTNNGTITINTGVDPKFELDETFLVSIYSFTNVTIDTPGVSDLGQMTITNNDAPPVISLDSVTVNEGETAIIPVSLSAVSGVDVVFDFITIDGLTPTLAARSGDLDYFGNGVTDITIPEGSLTVGLSVVTRTDTVDEYDEYFRVSLSSVTYATWSALDTRVTIVDQNIEPNLSIDDVTQFEGDTAHFTVTMDAISERLVEFNFQTEDGTAITSDYGVIAFSQGSIAAGNVTFGIAVSITNDSFFEFDETYSVSIGNAVHASVTDSSGVGTIQEDDALTISIVGLSAATADSQPEGTPLVVDVTLSTQSAYNVTFDFNFHDISAQLGDGDYSIPSGATGFEISAGQQHASLTVPTGNDTKFESQETFRVSLSNVTIASVNDSDHVNKMLIIQNDDTPPFLYVDSVTLAEGLTADFTISLSEESGLPVSLTFNNMNSGDATPTSDYDVVSNLHITIPAGSTSVPAGTALVYHVDDSDFEGGPGTYETYLVSLAPLGGSATIAGPATTVGIEDNDSPASLYVTEAGTLTEGSTFPFVVSLNSTPGQDVVFEWSILDGAASVAAGDFSGVTMATATIPDGDLAVTISVISVDDIELESTEDFAVTVTSLSANASGIDTRGIGNITDNDTLSIEFLQASQNVWEGDGSGDHHRQVFSAGMYHTCAIGRDKQAYCWGEDNYGGLGNGAAVTIPQSSPVRVNVGPIPDGILHEIGVGWDHSCALANDQRIYCWGKGNNGQIGNSLMSPRQDDPVAVSLGAGPGTYKSLSVGEYNNCAIGTDDRVYCWGSNNSGALGDGTGTNQDTPQAVVVGDGLIQAVEVANGQIHTCAIDTSGDIYCWGDNGWGALGNGSNTDSNVPVQVDVSGTGNSDFHSLVSGRGFSCALGSDDRAYCWGRNTDGELGDNNIGSDTNVAVAVSMGAGPGTYKFLEAGYSHTCGLATDDKLYCWGQGSDRQLGNGATGDQDEPVEVVAGASPGSFKSVNGGWRHTCALATDDYLYCWGRGMDSQLGDGSTAINVTAGAVVPGDNSGIRWAHPYPELEFILELSSTYYTDNLIPFTVAGTASNPQDHSISSGNLVVPRDKRYYSFNFDIVDDGVVEPDETVQFDLSGSPTVGGYGTVSTHVATIINDDASPSITDIILPADMIYGDGALMDFTVSFSEGVTVTGSPRIPITVGVSTEYANYLSGDSSSTLTFRYIPSSPDADSDGVAFVNVNPFLEFNSGYIGDQDGGNAMNLDASSVTIPSMAAILVDTDGPNLTITRAGIQPYNTNVPLVTFSFTFSEDIDPATFTAGDLALFGAASPTLVAINTITADNTYEVILGAQSDGIAGVNLSFGSVDDVAGNAHDGTNNTNNQVQYDGTAPNITGLTPPANATYTGGVLDFTVNFDENVNVSASNSTLEISLAGSTYNATYQGGGGTSSLNYQLNIPAGVEEPGGIVILSPLQDGGDTLDDDAGNLANLSFTPPNTSGVVIDSLNPSITDWSVPADGVYTTGANLDFVVTFSENVTVPGGRYIEIQMDSGTRNAFYSSGSGSNSILFRYTVAGGDSDVNGITIPTFAIQGTGDIQDVAGNNLSSYNLGVKDTSGVLVGAPPVLFLDGSGGSTLDGVPITTCGGGDICGSANPYVLTTTGPFSSVSLVNGAVMTTGAYSGSGSVSINNGMLELNVQDTLFVGPGAVISMSGKGYPMEGGSGVGSNHSAASGGGGHAAGGGSSGYSTPVSGGTSNGDVTISSMGSGSGRVTNGSYGARGGGIIEISVGNLADINGEIRADGQRGQGNGSFASGGGAGGTIRIDTVSLSGSGDLYARGGMGHAAGAAYGGGGSGGRIIIYYEQDIGGALDRTRPIMTGGGSLGLRAHGEMGGIAGREMVGGAGTVFYDDTNDANDAYLWVHNNSNETEQFTKVKTNIDLEILEVSARSSFEITAGTTLSAQEYEISNNSYFRHSGHLNSPNAQTVRFDFNWTWDGGTIQGVIPGGYVTIPDNFTMTFTDHTLNVTDFELAYGFNNELTHLPNTGTSFYRVDIDASNDIYIGAYIDVNGKGNPGGYSAAPGAPSNLSGSGDLGAAGGSYGGQGGDGSDGAADTTYYGDILGDLTLGAGGANADTAQGGHGGGYIRLRAANNIILDDAYLLALGNEGSIVSGGGDDRVGGGGSGGAIELISSSLNFDNNTYIYAYGGEAQQAGPTWGGAGGAGRLYYEFDTVNSMNRLRNRPDLRIFNSGFPNNNGAPGPIVIHERDVSYLEVVLDSDNHRTNAESPLVTSKVTTLTLSELSLREGPKVVVPSGLTLDLDSSTNLDITDNSYNPAIFLEGQWQNTVQDINFHLGIRNSAGGTFNPATNFTIQSGGVLEIGHNQLIDWSTVNMDVQGYMTHSDNESDTVDHQIYIRLNDLDINSFGVVSVTGKGFGPGLGPGAGQNAFTNMSFGGGGGHGGKGADSASGMFGGLENDDAFAPTLAGSGGGARFDGSGSNIPYKMGYGGGVVRFDVLGDFFLAGDIYANGVDSSSGDTYGYGSGAGGSVSISVGGSFTGFNGDVQAEGGECHGGCSAGGGGGGRIWLPMQSSGNIFVSANGGTTSFSNNGEPGSIYRGPATLDLETASTTMQEPSFLNGLTISLTPPVPYAVTLSVQTILVDAETEDFNLHTNTIIIAESQTSALITLDILDDSIWEGPGV